MRLARPCRPGPVQVSYQAMLDYKFIKDKLDEVKKNIAERYMHAAADLVVSLYDEKIGLQRETE